jgi:hypothetical protein
MKKQIHTNSNPMSKVIEENNKTEMLSVTNTLLKLNSLKEPSPDPSSKFLGIFEPDCSVQYEKYTTLQAFFLQMKEPEPVQVNDMCNKSICDGFE